MCENGVNEKHFLVSILIWGAIKFS
jgi:hypothetical protein